MLHVILTILKIIGILLLVLILLVIFILLALLLVPVRYQLEAAYTDESRKGDLRLTWLLHFFSFRLSYDLKERKGGTKIRVLGIDPRSLSRFFRRSRKKKKKSARPEPEPVHEKQENPEAGNESNPEPKQENNPGEKKREEEKKAAEKRPKRTRKKRVPLYVRIRRFFKKQIYKLREICARIEKIRDEKHLFREVTDRIGRLLHHYRVRKGRGYLKFGTGDPAATGELTGFLYILLPVSCGDIELSPQFNEAMLQTEVSVRGHIRLIHLLQAVLWGVFNRELRQFIRDVSGS